MKPSTADSVCIVLLRSEKSRNYKRDIVLISAADHVHSAHINLYDTQMLTDVFHVKRATQPNKKAQHLKQTAVCYPLFIFL